MALAGRLDYPLYEPKQHGSPRPPRGNASPIRLSWPRSCSLSATSAIPGAGFGGSTRPSSRPKRLADFDSAALPDLPPGTLAHLAGGAWIDAGEPLVLLGDSGTGKTHLLIALGTAAAEQGRRVRYVTTAALVNELVEAADDKQLSRVVGRYARLDLLCLDELGYVRLDPRGAELLFQIITAREERASIACASNAPFSEWSATFTDPRLAAAVVDRLTFNAHIIQTGTASYRLRATRAAKKGAANT